MHPCQPLAALLIACAAAGCAAGPPPASVSPTRHLTLGQQVTDRLTRSDPTYSGRGYYHTWFFEGTAGQRVAIDMTSSNLDPYVVLQDSTGTELAHDDDSGEGLNARLRHTLRYTGRYRILANSYRQGRRGAYSLRLAEAGVMLTDVTGVRGPIARGESRVGMLTAGDPAINRITAMSFTMDRNGRIIRSEVTSTRIEFHAYLFTARAGDSITVEMRSDAVDSYLILQEADGTQLLTNDDGGGGLNARLTYTFTYAGTFRIVASTAGAMHFGPYTLTVN